MLFHELFDVLGGEGRSTLPLGVDLLHDPDTFVSTQHRDPVEPVGNANRQVSFSVLLPCDFSRPEESCPVLTRALWRMTKREIYLGIIGFMCGAYET